jgi:hypothetical protein
LKIFSGQAQLYCYQAGFIFIPLVIRFHFPLLAIVDDELKSANQISFSASVLTDYYRAWSVIEPLNYNRLPFFERKKIFYDQFRDVHADY